MTTIAEYRAQILDGSKTAVELTEGALAKLEQVNETHNATISTLRASALERAQAIDERLRNGDDCGRLAGVPFIAKDNILALGGETTAASNILKGFQAPYQATVIDKLEAEGAICIAKANLDSFGHGASTENSDFGPTKNPHDHKKVPGGSSGGSAAAVALDIVPFSIGTDTGGSIRQPSSFCGVVGLKPTYGRVSRYGVVAMASSTDTVGPIAHTVEDAALVLDIIAGKDERDSNTLPERELSYADIVAPKKLRLAVIKEYMSDDVDSGVRQQIRLAVDAYRAAGHEVEEVSIPSMPYALAVYYVVVPAEISSNLARYDGIRYGLSAAEAKSLAEVYGLTRDQGFNAENKRRILIGTYVLSSGYYDAYYRQAQLVRTALINEFSKAFEQYDILLGPVAPTTAFAFGENTKDPLKMYLADIMTVAPSLVGAPAISVPAGSSEGMPVGAQLIANYGNDALLLKAAAVLEGRDG